MIGFPAVIFRSIFRKQECIIGFILVVFPVVLIRTNIFSKNDNISIWQAVHKIQRKDQFTFFVVIVPVTRMLSVLKFSFHSIYQVKIELIVKQSVHHM